MPSSTSPFESVCRNRLFALAGVLALVYGLCAVYIFKGNAEVRFWKKAYETKTRYAAALQSSVETKIVFAGGSGVAFQIDSGLLDSAYDIPAVNVGMHAGMGLPPLLAMGLEFCRKGDSLVCMIEPHLLFDPPVVTPLGHQILAPLLESSLADRLHTLGAGTTMASWAAMRPGLQHVVTRVGTLLLGSPAYRYRTEDILSSGALRTTLRLAPFSSLPAKEVDVHPDVVRLFQTLRHAAEARGCHMYITLPWHWSSEDHATHRRLVYERLLASLERSGLNVLREPEGGVFTDTTLFADTVLHTTPEGTAFRTRRFAETLLVPVDAVLSTHRKEPSQ